MRQAIVALRALWKRAATHVGMAGGPATVIKGAEGVIKATAGTIDALENPGIPNVQKGVLTYEAWMELARSTARTLESLPGFTDRWTFAAIASRAADDLKAAASRAGEFGSKWVPVAIFMVGLFLLVGLTGNIRALAGR